MSKLIQLRQRSKAIETIKKITHAMRLISMSTHSHLQKLQESLHRYTREIDLLFAQLVLYAPKWRNPIIHTNKERITKIAVILIGSQKGLCGSFNTQLFKLFTHEMITRNMPSFDLIAVGKKAVDFAKTEGLGQLQQFYTVFTANRLVSIAQEITRLLLATDPPYTSVLIMSNTPKSFFVQTPVVSDLIPIIPLENMVALHKEGFAWEEAPEKLLDALVPQYLEAKLQHFLFQSLVAEYAARFISMDSATRNAKELLEENNLEYNKLRQAKITKELSELVSSYK